MTYEDIPVGTWFTYERLYDDMVAQAVGGAIFVEVGSFLGRSSAYMGYQIKKSEKRIFFYCVDAWDNWAGSAPDHLAQKDVLHNASVAEEGMFEAWDANMRQCGVRNHVWPIRRKSVDAARLIFADKSVDFCFIDASHDYQSVLDDIAAWRPKMKPGVSLPDTTIRMATLMSTGR